MAVIIKKMLKGIYVFHFKIGITIEHHNKINSEKNHNIMFYIITIKIIKYNSIFFFK